MHTVDREALKTSWMHMNLPRVFERHDTYVPVSQVRLECELDRTGTWILLKFLGLSFIQHEFSLDEAILWYIFRVHESRRYSPSLELHTTYHRPSASPMASTLPLHLQVLITVYCVWRQKNRTFWWAKMFPEQEQIDEESRLTKRLLHCLSHSWFHSASLERLGRPFYTTPAIGSSQVYLQCRYYITSTIEANHQIYWIDSSRIVVVASWNSSTRELSRPY